MLFVFTVVPQPVENPAYAALKTIFMSLDDKPTEHAILFAVLKTVLSYYLNLSVNVEKNGWPGGATYNSKVYQLMVPDYCKKKDDGTPERKALHTFNFVVLKTADEYFLSLRVNFLFYYNFSCLYMALNLWNFSVHRIVLTQVMYA